MHYFIFANKDSYITEKSPSHIVLDADSNLKNYGADEILELSKEFVNSYSTSSHNTSRILIKFDMSRASKMITNGEIDVNDSSFSATLKLTDVYGGQTTPTNYKLIVFPFAKNFDEGSGRDIIRFSD